MTDIDKRIIPDFFIVGAAKAGTTALYHILSQHPEVYLSPIKEPNYFSTDIKPEQFGTELQTRLKEQSLDDFLTSGMDGILHRAYIRDHDQYLSLFANAQNNKAVGEASVSYLFSQTAAKEIYKFNPSARIIIVLRNPLERAYSHYLMEKKLGYTNLDFNQAIQSELSAKDRKWGKSFIYIEAGLYYQQVKRYLDVFPASQVHIILYSDFKDDLLGTSRKLFQFLGINDEFIPDNKLYNETLVPRSDLINRLGNLGNLRIKLRKILKGSKLKPVLKNFLYTKPGARQDINADYISYFRKDILKLQELIKRDLSSWL